MEISGSWVTITSVWWYSLAMRTIRRITSSALENVSMPLMFKGMGAKKRNKLAGQMLEQVGLGERMKHKPHEFLIFNFNVYISPAPMKISSSVKISIALSYSTSGLTSPSAAKLKEGAIPTTINTAKTAANT